MGEVEVDLGEGEVAADHLHRGVAEEALEGEGVATVAQEWEAVCVTRLTIGAVWCQDNTEEGESCRDLQLQSIRI